MALFPALDRGDPRHRLVLLAALLAAVLLAMRSCHLASQDAESAAPAPAAVAMVPAGPGIDPADPLPGVDATREFNHNHIDAFLPLRETESAKLADLAQLGPSLGAIFGWLKARSPEELRRLARPRGDYTIAKLLGDSERWSLQLIHLYGLLAFADQVEIPAQPAGLSRLHRLIVFDDRQQAFYCVLTPLLPRQAQVGRSMVGVDGVFAGRYAYRVEAGWRSCALLLAREVWPARESPPPADRLDERGDPGTTYQEIAPTKPAPELNLKAWREQILAPGKSGDLKFLGGDFREEVHDLRNEPEALAAFFSHVWARPAVEWRARVNPEVDYLPLMQSDQPPEWMRGQAVAVRAQVLDVTTWRLPDAPGGISRFHVVTAYDTRLGFDFTWSLAVLNLPEGLRRDDRIDTEGLFYKLYPYRTVGRKWHWTPLLVCRELRLVPPDWMGRSLYDLTGKRLDATEQAWVQGGLLAVLGALFLGGFWLLYRTSLREAQALADRRRNRQRRRTTVEAAPVSAEAAADTPSSASSPPPPEAGPSADPAEPPSTSA